MQTRYVPEIQLDGDCWRSRKTVQHFLTRFGGLRCIELKDVRETMEDVESFLDALVREGYLHLENEEDYYRGEKYDELVKLVFGEPLKVYVHDRGVYGMGFVLATSEEKAREIMGRGFLDDGCKLDVFEIQEGLHYLNTGDE